MGLVKEIHKSEFDTEQIKKGMLMYVKHESWMYGIAGIVTYVSKEKITVQYHPDIANVTTRQDIFAEDVSAGGYTIRWSVDLSSVKEYPEVTDNDS